MLGPAVLALVAGSVALTILVALYDRWMAGREADRLRGARTDALLSDLEARVDAARRRFSTAVSRHEQALESGDRVLAGSTMGDGASDPAGTKSVEDLDAERASARAELKAAGEELRRADPGHGPESRVHAWYGSGVVRSWQLGPIGFERFWLRLDHALDPSCWIVYGVTRPRFGFGLGVERQRLALTSLRASVEQLPILVRAALDGRELAFRPGLVPSRWWYRLRRPSWSRPADRGLLRRARVSALGQTPSPELRRTVLDAFDHEIGQPLDELAILPKGPGLLRIVASGPSWCFGGWSGPAPRIEVTVSSPHDAWRS